MLTGYSNKRRRDFQAQMKHVKFSARMLGLFTDLTPSVDYIATELAFTACAARGPAESRELLGANPDVHHAGTDDVAT